MDRIIFLVCDRARFLNNELEKGVYVNFVLHIGHLNEQLSI